MESGPRHGKKRRKEGGRNEKGSINEKAKDSKPKIKGKTLAIQPGESLGHFNRYVIHSPLQATS